MTFTECRFADMIKRAGRVITTQAREQANPDLFLPVHSLLHRCERTRNERYWLPSRTIEGNEKPNNGELPEGRRFGGDSTKWLNVKLLPVKRPAPDPIQAAATPVDRGWRERWSGHFASFGVRAK